MKKYEYVMGEFLTTGKIIDVSRIPNYKSREAFENELLMSGKYSDEDDAKSMAWVKYQLYLEDYSLETDEVCDLLNSLHERVGALERELLICKNHVRKDE